MCHGNVMIITTSFLLVSVSHLFDIVEEIVDRGGALGGVSGFGGENRDFKKMQPGEKLRGEKSLRKNYYKPHPVLVAKSLQEVEQYRASKEITVHGSVPFPITSLDIATFLITSPVRDGKLATPPPKKLSLQQA